MAASLQNPLGDATPAPSATAENTLRLSLMLGGEVLLMTLLRLPWDLSFNAFAFGDRGSWMMLRYLVAHGARPAVDFGYAYGLLPVWLSAGWFGLFGANPFAYQVAATVCGLAMAWAIARMAVSLRLPTVAIVLLLVALPFAIQTIYPSLAHAAEAALLCNALAEHAAGRRGNALALTTAACFCKPSMGYLYGFILLVLIQLDLYRRRNETGGGWRAALRTLAPASITGLALIAILGSVYGPISLGRTLLPLAGVRNYAALDFGFFHGNGRFFWSGTPLIIAVFTVIAFWFAASFWLIAGAVLALWRLLREGDEASRRRDEFIVAAAALHLTFVVAFFGGPSSWTYYSYILVMGAAAACIGSRVVSIFAFGLLLLAITGETSHRAADISLWRTSAPSADTNSLWASSDERAQWITIIDALRGRRVPLISAQGCAPLFAPRALEPNDFAYMLPGIIGQSQFDSALGKYADAPMLVVVVAPGYGAALEFWPQLQELLAQRQLVLKNGFFALYRRTDAR